MEFIVGAQSKKETVVFRDTRYRTIVVALLAALLLVNAGCIGSFKLTSNLHRWNSDLEGKAVQELVFLCFVILPVYGISLLADGIVLNSLEFWSGDNPLATNEKTIEDGPYVVHLERSETPEGRTLRVCVYEEGNKP